MSGTKTASARMPLPTGAWVASMSRNGRPPSFDTGLGNGEAAQLAAEGKVQGLFGGLLHNRHELNQLIGLERNGSEAGAVVGCYLRHGESVLEHLEGVFAVVLWDSEDETLLVVRDPLGSYPLFYAEGAGNLYVSNSIHALLAQRGVSNAVNVPALADHLRHRWPWLEETYFEAVYRVPPGHALRDSRSGRRTWRYWDPAPTGAIDWVDENELDQFDTLFERAVTRCLANGNAGIFLSGGLDSVSVAAVAAASSRCHDRPDLWALSLAFPDPEANEESRQRAVAAALGLPQVVLSWEDAVAPRGLMSAALELTAASPAPLLNFWMPAYDRLALEGRARGCSVILTGNGGDEWLSVSPYYAADLIRAIDVRRLHSLFNAHRRSHRVSSHLYLRNVLWRFGARPLLLDNVKRALARSPWLARELLEVRYRRALPDWLAPDQRLRRAVLQRSLEGKPWLERGERRTGRPHPRVYIREMRAVLDHPIVAMELEEVFEQGRRLGVHVQQPFWDAELVAFLYRTPPELLNRAGRTKGLVRETVARRFPRLGFDTQRKVAGTDFARSLVIEEGRRMWTELGGATSLAEAGIVDSRRLNERLGRIINDPQSRDYHLVWDVLALESWLRGRE
jgi:asparagine synthetase B (glutamine-hydrolysing)